MSDAPAHAASKPLKIAIATNDLENLNAHFGSAKKVALYEVTANDSHLVEVVEFDQVTEQAGAHNDTEDRITPKVDALAGSVLLFVLAIGGPSAAKVVRAGIHPVKVKEAEPIPAVIERVQTMLKSAPPPWLRKILGQAPERPSFMDDDEEETIQ
ncbi:nitrogen fixation protein NifX [Consotaella aegiceratis]|uniref:nitrogen fixation protein NifX n=1 Tax=Consotaella aegiceratis TaxID=3097961 RepID=UPI002F3E25F3